MKKSISRTAVVAVAAALALSACTGEERATFDQGATPTQSSQAQSDDTSAASAAAAGVDLTELGTPIATATVPAVVEGDPEATMVVSLYSLKRDGKTLTGTFSFLVDSDSASATPKWLYDYLGNMSWEPYLVDTTNLARHDVLGDFKGWAMTDSQGAKFRPGQTYYAYASFAVPAPEITTMTVNLVEGAPAAPKVSIQ